MKKEMIWLFSIFIAVFSVTAVAQSVVGTQTIASNNTEITDADIEILNQTYAVKGALPDTLGYPFKRLGEALKMWFTFNPIEKQALRLEFAKERMAEAKAMIERNKIERAIELLGEYQRELSDLEKEINQTGIGQNVSEIVKKADDTVSKSLLVLEMVYDKVPVQARPGIETAINNSLAKIVRMEIIDQIKNQNITINATALKERIEERIERQNELAIKLQERLESQMTKAIERIDDKIAEAIEKNQTEKATILELEKNLTIARIKLREERIEAIAQKINATLTEKLERIEEKLQEANNTIQIGELIKERERLRERVNALNSELKPASTSVIAAIHPKR